MLGLALVVVVAAWATPADASFRQVEHAPFVGTYVIKGGDTLSAIAARFKLSVGELVRANKLKATTVLQIGARLRVPGKVQAKTAATSPPAVSSAVTTVVEPAAVRRLLDRWSAKAGVPAPLVRALAWIESGDQANTVNGVLQTQPATRSFVVDVLVGHAVPHTPSGDIEIGVLYLRHLLREFKGNQRLALAAWNEGDTTVLQQGVLAPTDTFVNNVLALAATM